MGSSEAPPAMPSAGRRAAARSRNVRRPHAQPRSCPQRGNAVRSALKDIPRRALRDVLHDTASGGRDGMTSPHDSRPAKECIQPPGHALLLLDRNGGAHERAGGSRVSEVKVIGLPPVEHMGERRQGRDHSYRTPTAHRTRQPSQSGGPANRRGDPGPPPRGRGYDSRRRWIAALFSPFDWYRGTSIEQAYRSLHAARVFLVELVAEEDLDALVPGVLARVQACLPATDPQRIELEKLPNADPKTKRAKLVRALERGFAASDEAHANIRRFRNVVLCSAVLITLATFLLVHEVGQRPTAVPLCFRPDITAAQAASLPVNQQAGSSRTVCPSGEEEVGEAPQSPSEFDIWIVAGLGLLGGGLSSAVSVRKMAHTAAPYDVPLALALLKLPTGALTAVAGIILLGGGFVPGLSELDTQRQILAYSLIFGYAQQLATRYLDDRATTLLAAVPSKHTPLI